MKDLKRNKQYHDTVRIDIPAIKSEEEASKVITEAVELCTGRVMRAVLADKIDLKQKSYIPVTGFIIVENGCMHFRAGIDDNPTPLITKTVDMDEGVQS